MIVDVASYTDGRRRDCTGAAGLPQTLRQCRSEAGSFVWIGLKDPTAEEFDQVSGELGLHPLAVEDAVRGRQRPKLERYGDTLFVVVKVLSYAEAESAVETGEVMVFIGERFVVTVRRGDVGSLAPVRRALEADPERLGQGPTHVLHAVLDAVVDGYVAVDRELEQDVEQMEEQVFSPSRTRDAMQIYNLKREVLEVRRAASPLLAALRAHLGGQDGLEAGGRDEMRFALRDVVDHLERTVEHVEGYDRLLTSILDAHLAQVSVQQNEDMRRISAWAAVFAVETLIAGIYGMNFTHMPELDWRLGYPAVLVLMVLVGTGLYLRFRRAGWL
ncbi:magnesium transporter [Kineococcus xinjiangensis]|uniref:Magnesium transport protein CorA n=1 Tax=Kineococcus xinjiangensis TaxID=512762 RepID=A0A2S6IKG9_9ACTN|nr:magnesium/cobalt transporter CorA [Kineococcus xinjiangensis]PPK94650.1 magnesium transporter [Kineococcus xinjiangensis]